MHGCIKINAIEDQKITCAYGVTELSIAQLAKCLNPMIHEWIGYYGRFTRSALYGMCRHVNKALVRWARRKFKPLRRHKTKAMKFVEGICTRLLGKFQRSTHHSQHWVLDVTFREDECQIYAEDGTRNLSTIRRKLLNLFKAHPLKDSVAGKLQRVCWDGKFRAEILFG